MVGSRRRGGGCEFLREIPSVWQSPPTPPPVCARGAVDWESTAPPDRVCGYVRMRVCTCWYVRAYVCGCDLRRPVRDARARGPAIHPGPAT